MHSSFTPPMTPSLPLASRQHAEALLTPFIDTIGNDTVELCNIGTSMGMTSFCPPGIHTANPVASYMGAVALQRQRQQSGGSQVSSQGSLNTLLSDQERLSLTSPSPVIQGSMLDPQAQVDGQLSPLFEQTIAQQADVPVVDSTFHHAGASSHGSATSDTFSVDYLGEILNNNPMWNNIPDLTLAVNRGSLHHLNPSGSKSSLQEMHSTAPLTVPSHAIIPAFTPNNTLHFKPTTLAPTLTPSDFFHSISPHIPIPNQVFIPQSFMNTPQPLTHDLMYSPASIAAAGTTGLSTALHSSFSPTPTIISLPFQASPEAKYDFGHIYPSPLASPIATVGARHIVMPKVKKSRRQAPPVSSSVNLSRDAELDVLQGVGSTSTAPISRNLQRQPVEKRKSSSASNPADKQLRPLKAKTEGSRKPQNARCKNVLPITDDTFCIQDNTAIVSQDLFNKIEMDIATLKILRFFGTMSNRPLLSPTTPTEHTWVWLLDNEAKEGKDPKVAVAIEFGPGILSFLEDTGNRSVVKTWMQRILQDREEASLGSVGVFCFLDPVRGSEPCRHVFLPDLKNYRSHMRSEMHALKPWGLGYRCECSGMVYGRGADRDRGCNRYNGVVG
ncbi:hypothetical protein HDU97_007605 [Phlyctochytrium planicorne]|nr:hypothetical protein HDU97_007605 [Phlyctochytrium planicorne]